MRSEKPLNENLIDGLEVNLPENLVIEGGPNLIQETDVIQAFPEEARTLLEPEPQLLMETGYQAPDTASKIWKGLNRMFDLSPPEIYGTLTASAEQAEEEGGLAGRYVAQYMRRAAGQAAAAKLGWQLLDIEERPRKMAINLAYVMKKNEVDPGQFPATTPLERWELYKKAIVDGFNGEEYTDAWTALHLQLPGVTEEHLETYHAFMNRHPALKLLDKADQAGVNLATAVITEATMWWGLKKSATLAKNFFTELGDRTLHRGFRRAVEARTIELIREGAWEEAWRVRPGQPAITPEQMAAALGGEAGEHVDDALKTALAKRYIKEVKKRKIVPAETVNKLVDAISVGTAKTIDDLTDVQLRALMDDLETIMMAPDNVRFAARIGEIGGIPSWKVFEHYKIPRAYDIMDDALHSIQLEQINRSRWVDDMVKGFEKTYDIKWSELTDELAARFADEGPDAKIPNELLDYFTDGQVEYVKRVVAEDRDKFWEPLADLAERQGLIGEGTEVPREQFYYHHRTRIHDFMKARAASKKKNLGILPADYYMNRLTKRKLPAKVNVPEFFARTLNAEDISYAWRDVTRVAHREELRKLLLEPAAREMDAIIGALPTELRKHAGEFASEWMRYIRGMPSVWDDRLNWFFNQASRGIEAVSRGRWQASGRAFENFARKSRRLIYTGTIGGNPRAITKNLTQSFLTVNTIGSRATLAGIESAYTDGGRRLLNQYRVMVGRQVWRGGLSMGEFNIANPKGWQKLLNAGFSGVDRYVNCIGAGNGFMWKAIHGNKKYMDELIEYAAKQGIKGDTVRGTGFWDTLASAVEDGHFSHLVDMANKNIKLTQYSYQSWDMPKHLWSQTGKGAFMFTSWPSNYFGGHLPQMFSQLIRGENVMGQSVNLRERLALFRHVARGLVLFETGRRLGYNMQHLLATGPMPVGRIHGYMRVPAPVSPPVEVATAIGSLLVGGMKGDETLIKEGWNGLGNVAPSFVPAGAGIRHVGRWLEGKQPVSAILFPMRPEKKPPARRRPMTIEEKLKRRLKKGLPILP